MIENPVAEFEFDLFQKHCPIAVAENIARLADYRNNAVHFYNESGFEVIIYGLAQTSIVNYRDIVLAIFDKDIAAEVNIVLLPLSFSSPPDPIAFLGAAKDIKASIAEFMKLISDTTKELEKEGIDTGRFLTVFEVNLQSTKKIKSADIVAGLEVEDPSGILFVSRKIDPNKSHPMLQKLVLEKIGEQLKGVKFSPYTFQAILWKHNIKTEERFCWHNINMNTFQYSHDLVARLKALTKNEIEEALADYRQHLRKRRRGQG